MQKTIDERVQNIIGQLEGILRLRKNKSACESILVQLKAVRSGINAVIQKTVEEELSHCAKNEEKQERVIKLLSELLK